MAKNIYCDQEELHKAIEEFYTKDQESIDRGEGGVIISNKLGNMIESIANGVTSAGNFIGHPERDEMIRSCVYKMVEIVNGKKFKLYGNRSEPVRTKEVFEGYRFPEMELSFDQKFVLLDKNDIHTLVVFKRMCGYSVKSEGCETVKFNNPKEMEHAGVFDKLEEFEGEVDFFDFKIKSESYGYSVKPKGRAKVSYKRLEQVNVFRFKVFVKLLNSMEVGDSVEINSKTVTKMPIFNEMGEYSYDKDISFKKNDGGKGGSNDPQVKTFSLKEDLKSTIEVDCCNTLKVEYNGKRYLEKRDVFFDIDSEEEAIQKNNAFAYLSKSCTFEGIRGIKNYKRRMETLDTYQKDGFTNFMANNPQVSHVRMEDDTYDDFLE